MSEKNNRNQISCDMVQDLLPLYQDGLVRDKTKDAVMPAFRTVFQHVDMYMSVENACRFRKK